MDLGLGFTTIRVASLYWTVALVAVVLASPVGGAVILGWYGLALTLNLGIGTLLLERKGCSVAATGCVLGLARPLRAGLVVILVAWSGMLLIAAL